MSVSMNDPDYYAEKAIQCRGEDGKVFALLAIAAAIEKNAEVSQKIADGNDKIASTNTKIVRAIDELKNTVTRKF